MGATAAAVAYWRGRRVMRRAGAWRARERMREAMLVVV